MPFRFLFNTAADFLHGFLQPGSITATLAQLPVRAFHGAIDRRGDALLAQWDRTRMEAEQRGCRDLTRVVVPGAGQSPFASPVIEYFMELAAHGG